MCELDLGRGATAACRLMGSEGIVSKFMLACPYHAMIAGHSVLRIILVWKFCERRKGFGKCNDKMDGFLVASIRLGQLAHAY